VNRKARKALETGVTAIVCVGETLAEREANRTADVIRAQFTGSLAGILAEQMRRVVIAYEPVWAIGTGRTASPKQAEEVHADLRKLLAQMYNDEVAEGTRILYGGSVKPSNAGDLLDQSNVDGALVGGASLVADDFLAIARAAG
jgi:triosephosphate isomerase